MVMLFLDLIHFNLGNKKARCYLTSRVEFARYSRTGNPALEGGLLTFPTTDWLGAWF